MGKAAKKKREHLADWRDRAMAFDWPVAEIDQLASVIAPVVSTERIVDVTRHEIQLLSTATLAIDGTGHDGVVRTHEIAYERRWMWHRSAGVETQESGVADADEPWCPAHGNACSPVGDRQCGLIGVAGRSLCGCPIRVRRWRGDGRMLDHQAGCSLGEPARPALPAAPPVRALPNGLASEESLEERLTHKERDRARRRGVLPGQLGLLASTKR